MVTNQARDEIKSIISDIIKGVVEEKLSKREVDEKIDEIIKLVEKYHIPKSCDIQETSVRGDIEY